MLKKKNLSVNKSSETKNNDLYVTKRNGRKEKLTLDKIHKVLDWATEGLSNVSCSELEIRSQIQFKEGIKTSEIHEILARTAADMISEDNPNYQYVSSRLRMFSLRKEVFGKFTPPHLFKFVKSMVEDGRYTDELMVAYSEEDFDDMNNFINHNRDFTLTWASLKQMEGKYLRKDRVTEKLFETPQFLFMMVAATCFMREPKTKRLKLVKDFYDAISTFDISLPTPIMAGLRTPIKQFSSCVLVESEDSLDSITATSNAIIQYISKKAGIGVNAGAIRAEGSKIRNGESSHTGVIPFYRLFQSSVKSCSQGGVRGGAATLFVPFWHLEIQDIMVLKNNKGTDDNRIKQLDYGIQFNGYLYNRLVKNEKITLFSPSEVPNLYETFFSDQKEFARLYEKYENDESIRKIQVPSFELFDLFIRERLGTGRLYYQNVDHCNNYGPFKPDVAPIRQSNLCLEIALPTIPLKYTDDPDAEIALCTLSAFNLGKIDKFDLNNDEEMKEALSWFKSKAVLAVRALDNILMYQDYLLKAAKKSTDKYRPLGIGVINYAYMLAKFGFQYSNDTAIKLTNHLFESMQYYCMDASIDLAKERGRCEGFDNLKLKDGSLPIDRYKKDVDILLEKHNANYNLCDWEALRAKLLKHGIRNATLTALMPSETSSQISNSTNGIEPPRDAVSIKASKDGILKQVIPGIDDDEIRYSYEYLYDQPSPVGYTNLVAVMQKNIDQSISANTSYDPKNFPDRKISVKTMLTDLLTAYKLGLKTGYYMNTNDTADSADNILDEDDCESCKI